MFLIVVFCVLMGVSFLYAIARGGPSERAAAIVTTIGVTISPVVAHQAPDLWQGSETGILIVDVVALAAYVTIMLVSTRFWPIWTTAFQLLTVTAHLGPLFRRAHVAFPFALDEEVWGYVIFVQLIIVTRLRTKAGTAAQQD